MPCIEVYVIDDVNVYGILNLCTATTSTTTSTTTAAPTTTSTTTSTTTAAATTTSTTTTTTTAVPTTTSTTTTTTTEEPTTTSTTTTTTTEVPTTTSTTTTTTTEEPTTTSTTTTTTTEVPTTTSTTTTTTTEVPTTTSTTTTTTTAVPITLNFTIINPESLNNMQFLGTLSAPVGADIKFNLLNVEGFQDTICLAQFDSGEYNNTGGLVTNIAEGDSGGYSAIPTTTFGWWNNNTPSSTFPLSYRFLPPTINGTLLTTSPQTIVIGGSSVIVNWADCVNTQLATTTTTTTAVPFETFSVRTDISTATICSSALVTVYTAFGATITTGTEVFTTSALLVPYIGADYIVDVAIGNIYAIGSGNGVIGGDTSLTC